MWESNPKHFACKANGLPLASRPKVVRHGIEPCSPVYRTDVLTILLHYNMYWWKDLNLYVTITVSTAYKAERIHQHLRSITDSNREHLIDNQRLYHFTNRPNRVLPARFELAWNSTLKVWRLNHVALGSISLRGFDILVHKNIFEHHVRIELTCPVWKTGIIPIY